jgi:predicted  nucleic acid-binding Zn-ribbon protein
MAEVDVMERIESIEREVEDLKDSVKTKDTTMKGRLSRASFDEEDFEEAKKSLFEGV